MTSSDARKTVAHIIFRFDFGGLENGIVNLINNSEQDRLNHIVIALSEVTDFANRLKSGVKVVAIGKKDGKDPHAYFRLYKLLRQLKPDIVHTRNVGTLDCIFIAFLARVPVRIHGEHGWDVTDPDGKSKKYRLIRRLFFPFVHHITTVSKDLRRWLLHVGLVNESKVTHICNGVDTSRFSPRDYVSKGGSLKVGSVTRFSEIKDPLNLVDAFRELVEKNNNIQLEMVGDGALRAEAIHRTKSIADKCSFPGSRNDIPAVLKGIDIFVLGSLREGISNTILEAMSAGLPVVASDTGGNSEIVIDGETGLLVEPGDSHALAQKINYYLENPDQIERHGRAGRELVQSSYSIVGMVRNYENLYMKLLGIGGLTACVE